jgi:hypothetical protein
MEALGITHLTKQQQRRRRRRKIHQQQEEEGVETNAIQQRKYYCTITLQTESSPSESKEEARNACVAC